MHASSATGLIGHTEALATSGNPVNERWGPTSARRLPKVGGLYPAHDPMGALG